MNRRFVNQLGHQEAIDQVFLAMDKQLRPNRNGNLYLQVELSDRSGRSAPGCGTPRRDYRAFENGDFVRVEGATQLYQGAMQLIATSIVANAADERSTSTISCRSRPPTSTGLAVRLARAAAEMKTRTCATWPSAFWSTRS